MTLYSYINYEGSLLTVKAQHGSCFDTVIGTIVCDPNDGTQYRLNGETLDDVMFIDRLKQLATANDWHAYYATRNHALTLIPFWVWCHIWYGYSTIWCFAMTRRKIDMEYRHWARR